MGGSEISVRFSFVILTVSFDVEASLSDGSRLAIATMSELDEFIEA